MIRKDMICLIDSSVTKWDYVDDFLKALCNVDPGYYMYSPAHTGYVDSVREKVYTERVFAYEFYHQYRCIMDNDEKDKYKDIILNGEQTKTREVVPDLERCAPDLVMHKKIGAADPDGQLWVCEIKMASIFFHLRLSLRRLTCVPSPQSKRKRSPSRRRSTDVKCL